MAMPLKRLALKNLPLPPTWVDSFEAETNCRHAYLKHHPSQPAIKNYVPKNLFSAGGRSVLGAASPDIADRLEGSNFMVNPHYAVWQVPSQAVFVALFHLTAGASACADLPLGTFAFGGAVAASLAVPAFDDEGCRIDFGDLHAAGRAIGKHLAAAKAWRESFSPSLADRRLLPRPLLRRIEGFAGFEKRDLARVAAAILAHHNVYIEDGSYDDSNDSPESCRHDGNWSWWLTNKGHAPYARTDVDYYVTGSSLRQASERAEALKVELCAVLGEHTAVRTPNTLTLCPAFPARHVQIVLTAHRDPASVMLFADLDSTSASFDGRRVLGSGRFCRALREGVNVVPVGMWAMRDDTLGRAAKYVRRGFGVCLGARKHRDRYPKEARKEVFYVARMSPRYFTADGGDANEVTLQLQSNTAYDEYKIPRGPGVTPEIVKMFFIQQGAEMRLLDATKPLCCEWRLSRKPEDWVLWGWVPSRP